MSGCKCQAANISVQLSGCKCQGANIRVQLSGCKCQGANVRVQREREKHFNHHQMTTRAVFTTLQHSSMDKLSKPAMGEVLQLC